MKRFISMALILPVFLVGCGADDSGHNEPVDQPRVAQVEKAKNFTKIQLDYNQRDAFKFTMDGTDCIMATNEQAVALSCDWSNNTK